MSEQTVRLPAGAPPHLGDPIAAYRQGRLSRTLFAARLAPLTVPEEFERRLVAFFRESLGE